MSTLTKPRPYPQTDNMTITQPSLRSRADQSDILLSFADRLRTHPLLNTQNVVITDQPVPEQFPGGAFCVTICPGPGEFPQELWAGGHHATATEDGSVIVSIYTQHKRDRPGRREASLLGRRTQDDTVLATERPPMLVWKRDILQLLTVETPANGSMSQSWEPDKDGVPLCRDIPAPRRCTQPLDVAEHPGWQGMQITFAVAWDWNLYNA